MTISCKNCSIEGTVDLTHGMFTTTESNDANTTASIQDFYEDGYVEMTVNNFQAHIELESTIVASQSIMYYTAPFPDISIPGFSIPGIAEVGPVFRPRVTFGVQVASGLDFTYGLDVTIPNNSTILLNIKNATNSSITGFQNSVITALPFQSQIDSLNLTTSIAFNPQLLLTVSILDNDGSISAGAFLDLPKISATVAQVDHVDAKCNPTNATDSSRNYIANSLTNIIPSVEMDVGVIAEAMLKAGEFYVDDQAVYTAFSTDFALPTACLSYDAAKKTYGPPATSSSHGSASASGSASKGKSGASMRAENPIGAGSMLALVTAFFFLGFFAV